MKRALFISLALVLAVIGWSLVCAQDFYVIPAQKGNFAPVPKTMGQTLIYAPGDDGSLQKGMAWPTPRFTDNLDGTVTDNLTGLIWMKNANSFGNRTWAQALSDANGLADGSHGLTDGSTAGDWRLPNVRELQSLIDYGRGNPALPVNPPFFYVQSAYYWSSTTRAGTMANAWFVHFSSGFVSFSNKDNGYFVWCVRDPK